MGVTFIILLNSYILLISERVASIDTPYCYDLDTRKARVHSYRDALWLNIITFMTVGYGDFYPTTNIGRVVEILTVLSG